MSPRFLAASLVSSPLYPDSIAWSDENLLAVCTDHIVTILSPTSPLRPRGFVTLPTYEPLPIGVIERQDLLKGCMLSNALFRDRRACVRSISWSPRGMSPNSGCLLAVCTVEGRVRLYRAPFCDFCAEWIEVMDITKKLYDYLARIDFEVSEFPSSASLTEQATEHENLPNPFWGKERKRRKVKNAIVRSSPYPGQGRRLRKATGSKEDSSGQLLPVGKSNGKQLKKMSEDSTQPLITADQYASRNAMFSSLIVAWSPVIHPSSKVCPVPPDGSFQSCSLLAVGGKSGKISVWRIHEPQYYSVEQSEVPVVGTLVGLFQAHKSWVTAINWAFLASESSNPHVVMVTGSSDGSVRIWEGYIEELQRSSDVNQSLFVLLKEVIIADSVPVSVLSLHVSVQLPHQLLLAIGKGSGGFEIWKCDISGYKFDNIGSYNVHDHVVTGLAWAFDGCCLYSCSQDNLLRGWIFNGSSLYEVPIPSNIQAVRSSTDLPDVFNSCFGVAVSPGNLVLALVRRCDGDLLHKMYEGRIHKAIVEFFWIGGHQLSDLSSITPELFKETLPGVNQKELVYWEDHILWSLRQYQQLDKPLVVWDIVGAILAFKQTAPKYIEHILVKWLSITFAGSDLGLSTENILSRAPKSFSTVTSRQLHLLNIICRRAMLSNTKAKEINNELQKLEGLADAKEEQYTLWMELLKASEKELRERLVSISFSALISLILTYTARHSRHGNAHPGGLAQMKQWVAFKANHVNDKLKLLAERAESRCKRYEYVVQEQCSYCSQMVQFESPEVAFCGGLECSGGVGQNRELARCAVSMQICPTRPIWFCMCCHRQASVLAPETLFTMSAYPVDFPPITETSMLKLFSRPLCPFCGILLQRLQPESLLSTSPV